MTQLYAYSIFEFLNCMRGELMLGQGFADPWSREIEEGATGMGTQVWGEPIRASWPTFSVEDHTSEEFRQEAFCCQVKELQILKRTAVQDLSEARVDVHGQQGDSQGLIS